MSADDSHPQPVIVLRVVIRSPDLDTFVTKYSRFIKDDRIFIFTKSSQPPGTQVRFTLELSDGQPLIHGEGTVTRVRPESADVSKPPGMELKFVPLDQRSRELVARMLQARDGQFREEPTDAQTQVRSTTSPAREFEERPPTLPTLPQTGAFSALAPALGLLPRTDPEMPRQDESGAVTLAQSQPTSTPARPPLPSSAFDAPSTIPSGGFTQPVATGAGSTEPLATSAERHSGSYSSPTPLPAPIPAGSEESFVGPSDGSRPNRTGAAVHVATPARALPVADEPRAFAAHGPAPPFAESFRTPLPGQPPTAAPTGTVPANPFSDVSDGAIEYFVEWSLEQSRDAKPKVAQASFSNVKMVTPHVERIRTRREPFLMGMLLGLVIGVIVGASAMHFEIGPALLTSEHPLTPPARTTVVPDLAIASATATATAAPLAKPEATKDAATAPSATTKPTAEAAKPATSEPTKPPSTEPTKPAGATAKVVDWAKAPVDPAKPALDADGKPLKVVKAELQVTSKPPGAAVSLDGQDKGKTPLTLTVPAGAHEVAVAKERYATVTQSVTAPGKLDVSLKRPTATLHVDSDPAGGDVVVEGKPRGKTPVDVTLEAFHHYDVSVTLLGTKPWHKRVSLKPPQVDVTAKLLVVHGE